MSNTERIRPPWWLKYVNKVMIGLQKLGVGGDKGPVILVVPRPQDAASCARHRSRR